MEITSQKRWVIAAYIVLTVLALLAVLPFVLLIIASFTDEITAIRDGYSYFPASFSLEAYRFIWNERIMIGNAYLVTIFVTLIGTSLSLLFTSMFAYMLSKKDLPGRKVITFLVIFTMLFNGGLVPTYLVYSQIFHIKDTLWALIVPSLLMNAFSIILVKNYYEHSIPKEIYESARMDGANEGRLLLRIVLPLSKPILATVGLLSGIAYWNDWQNGLYYLNDTRLYSIQNILNAINTRISFLAENSYSGAQIEDLPMTTIRMAIAVVGVLPILVLYPIFQRYFIKGIVIGAVKE